MPTAALRALLRVGAIQVSGEFKPTVHWHELLCGTLNGGFGFGGIVTVSRDINEVTCQRCVYFYFKPSAKALNDQIDEARRTR